MALRGRALLAPASRRRRARSRRSAPPRHDRRDAPPRSPELRPTRCANAPPYRRRRRSTPAVHDANRVHHSPRPGPLPGRGSALQLNRASPQRDRFPSPPRIARTGTRRRTRSRSRCLRSVAAASLSHGSRDLRASLPHAPRDLTAIAISRPSLPQGRRHLKGVATPKGVATEAARQLLCVPARARAGTASQPARPGAGSV